MVISQFTRATIERSNAVPVSKGPVEFVERKGKGHPDTICDKAAEELSIALSEYYRGKFGNILHHNVDKCVLAGGQSRAYFGGGEIIEPIYLLLVGRAAYRASSDPDKIVPVGRMAARGTRDWMKREFTELDVDCDLIVDYRIKPGSVDLVANYDANGDIPLANDTSFAVAFGPFTETERLVYHTETLLNSEAFHKDHPAVGPDVKVMGLRTGAKTRLTVAAAIVSRYVSSPSEYQQLKSDVADVLLAQASRLTGCEVEVQINAADNPSSSAYYLTVSGLSAEHGDDGQVGRGNRANGLITPFRPMTLEATAGKNPTSHVGKLYNVSCQSVVDTLLKDLPDLEQAYCYMLSQIGRPVDQPQSVHVEAIGNVTQEKLKSVTEPIIEQTLTEIPHLWEGFIKREYSLF